MQSEIKTVNEKKFKDKRLLMMKKFSLDRLPQSVEAKSQLTLFENFIYNSIQVRRFTY